MSARVIRQDVTKYTISPSRRILSNSHVYQMTTCLREDIELHGAKVVYN